MWLKFLHIPKAFRCTNPKQERARYDTFQRMKKERERERDSREKGGRIKERESLNWGEENGGNRNGDSLSGFF